MLWLVTVGPNSPLENINNLRNSTSLHTAFSRHMIIRKGEKTIKIIKSLLTKSNDGGEGIVVALLDWLNTPSEGMASSPA